jgi:hypothetical protein
VIFNTEDHELMVLVLQSALRLCGSEYVASKARPQKKHPVLLGSFTKSQKVHVDTVPRVSNRLTQSKRLQRKGFGLLFGRCQSFA